MESYREFTELRNEEDYLITEDGTRFWGTKVLLLQNDDIGKGKHAKLGSIYNPKGYKMQTPSEEVQQQCIQILTDYGLKATIGG